MKKNIIKGNYVVIKKNNNIITKKANKGLLIECKDNIEVTSKAFKDLTKEEKSKIK